MKRTMKKIIYSLSISLVLLSCGSSGGNGQLSGELGDLFLGMDSLSFDELKALVIKSNDEMQVFAPFMKDFDIEGSIQNVSSEDESYDSEFDFTPIEFDDNFFEDVDCYQSIDYPNGILNLSTRYASFPEWYEEPEYLVTKGYYADGTIENINAKGYEDIKLKSPRRLDSVRVEMSYRYPTDVNKVTLQRGSEVKMIGNTKIELQRIDRNYAQVVITGAMPGTYIDMAGFNANGQCLESSSSSTGSSPQADKKVNWAKIIEEMQMLSDKVKADTYKTKEELKEAIVKSASKFPSDEDSDKFYTTKVFNGNVNSVVLYFGNKYEKKSASFTAANYDVDGPKIELYESNGKMGMVNNATGKFITEPVFSNLSQVTDRMYTSSDYYNDFLLRFDPVTMKMDTVKGYDIHTISPLGDGTDRMIVSQNGYYGVIDENGTVIVPLQYSSIRSSYADEPKGFAYAQEDEDVDNYYGDWVKIKLP